jgi:hypothetical protein
MVMWMFSGDLRFATEDFYDISYKGDDRDAYRVGFLSERHFMTCWFEVAPDDDEVSST